jgi:hypothetical protein
VLHMINNTANTSHVTRTNNNRNLFKVTIIMKTNEEKKNTDLKLLFWKALLSKLLIDLLYLSFVWVQREKIFLVYFMLLMLMVSCFS